MSDYETVLIEREGRVALVSFNRPEKLNSFNGTLRREFLRAAQEVNADNDVWVVVLTGAGRAFGAGADLSDTSEPAPNGAEGVEDQLNAEYKPGVLAIHHARKPWIAAVNGPCAGISYSYAMACDLMVMAESSYLFQPFVGIGLVPDGGATWLLPSLVGAKRAYELMAFGEKLGAEKAVEWDWPIGYYPTTTSPDTPCPSLRNWPVGHPWHCVTLRKLSLLQQPIIFLTRFPKKRPCSHCVLVVTMPRRRSRRFSRSASRTGRGNRREKRHGRKSSSGKFSPANPACFLASSACCLGVPRVLCGRTCRGEAASLG